MSEFNTDTLGDLYTRLSAPGGMEVLDFQAELADLFARARSDKDLRDYRLSRPPWKKLADEVAPVSRLLRFLNVNSGRVRFPLDNKVPDCWLQSVGSSEPVGIEVTLAQGTERYHLARELVDKGVGRGFIGIADDAPKADFERALSRPRVAYTSQQALSAIRQGILRCLSHKNKPAYAGFDLVVQAPLTSLPHERWDSIKGDLCAAAENLPFGRIYVIGNAEERAWGFSIK